MSEKSYECDASVTFGMPTKALCSVNYSLRDTKLYVSLRGPSYDRVQAKPNEGVFQVHITRSSTALAAGGGGRITTNILRRQHKMEDCLLCERIQETLGRILHHVVYSRMVFSFAIHVLDDQGCLMSAMLNGCMACLLEAGIACTTTLVSHTLMVQRSGSLNKSSCKTSRDANRTLRNVIINPTKSELEVLASGNEDISGLNDLNTVLHFFIVAHTHDGALIYSECQSETSKVDEKGFAEESSLFKDLEDEIRPRVPEYSRWIRHELSKYYSSGILGLSVS